MDRHGGRSGDRGYLREATRGVALFAGLAVGVVLVAAVIASLLNLVVG
jgi:hypothetical protein